MTYFYHTASEESSHSSTAQPLSFGVQNKKVLFRTTIAERKLTEHNLHIGVGYLHYNVSITVVGIIQSIISLCFQLNEF